MSTESHESQTGPDDPGLGLLDALANAERASMQTAETTERQSETWTRVVASVAVGGAPPVPPAATSGPATTATSLWVKVVLGVVVGGVVAATGYKLASGPSPGPNPDPTATQIATAVVESEDEPPGPPSPTPPALTHAGSPAPDPAPVARTPSETRPGRPTEAPVPKQAQAAPTKPSDPPASNLTEETRLLAKARARLRAASPADALAPLAEHARRFPHGQLTEDRLVLQAQALCESGDTNAGLKKAAALRKAYPSSSHLPRVHRACNP